MLKTKLFILFCLFLASFFQGNTVSAQAADGTSKEKARMTTTAWEQVRKNKWRAHIEGAPIFVFIGTTKDVHFRMERKCTSGTEAVESLAWRAGGKYGKRINCYGEEGSSEMPPQIEKSLKPLPQPIQEHLQKVREKQQKFYNSVKRIS